MAATIRQRVPITMNRAKGRAAQMATFLGLADEGEHFACVFGPLSAVPLVRVHSECVTGDLFGSTRCDCGPQLDEAMSLIAEEGGILLYLRQEGRGIGLYNKIDAYHLQDRQIDTFRANELLGRGADERSYDVAAQMLKALGAERIELLTNNPDKVAQLRTLGIEVVAERTTSVHLTAANARYLQAKREYGHALHSAELGMAPPRSATA
jgi:GTP cyclohydrolase II